MDKNNVPRLERTIEDLRRWHCNKLADGLAEDLLRILKDEDKELLIEKVRVSSFASYVLWLVRQ